MSKTPKPVPRLVRRIDGKIYTSVVLMVRTRNADGSPRLLEHLRDDDVANLSGSDAENDFIIAWLPVKALGG